MTLVGRLQKRTGAAVILTFAERLPGGRGYALQFERYRGDAIDEPAMNRAVEATIRRCPQQYLWSYNRYKVPAGVDPPSATWRRLRPATFDNALGELVLEGRAASATIWRSPYEGEDAERLVVDQQTRLT